MDKPLACYLGEADTPKRQEQSYDCTLGMFPGRRPYCPGDPISRYIYTEQVIQLTMKRALRTFPVMREKVFTKESYISRTSVLYPLPLELILSRYRFRPVIL